MSDKIPEELRDFANLMVEEVLAGLRAKIENGGLTIGEQREVIDCAVAEQEVKRKLRAEIERLREALRQIARPEGFSSGPECSRTAMFEIAARALKCNQ